MALHGMGTNKQGFGNLIGRHSFGHKGQYLLFTACEFGNLFQSGICFLVEYNLGFLTDIPLAHQDIGYGGNDFIAGGIFLKISICPLIQNTIDNRQFIMHTKGYYFQLFM
ncbi:hypothetical protein D3C85_1662730 [compost metagenome]